MAWLLPDEPSDRAELVFQRVSAEGAVVPMHWPLEILNALLMAERRGRIDSEYRFLALSDLGELSITVDTDTGTQAWRTTQELAVRHRLTSYDAAYLELAKRRRVALGVLDGNLARAARAEDVVVL